ncbi:MAG: AI-2E family transporter [Chloroflexi bacterium]|nr:AI-2E family transporter [Chloroflexota bacterium]
MNRTRLVNLLLVLLILIAALVLAQMLWQFLSGFADIILLFLLGWLVSFILNPIISALTENANPKTSIRFSRGAAVGIVYLAILVAIVLLIAYFVPVVVVQLTDLATHVPQLVADAPQASALLQKQVDKLGLPIRVEDALKAGLSAIQGFAATAIQNALGLFTGALGVVANLAFVLILSVYISLDEPRLRARIIQVAPPRIINEIRFLGASVDRTFGGFIRGQLIQALLQAGATALVMLIFQLDFAVVASLFAGVFMLIPLVGPFLALLPPFLLALIVAPSSALTVLLILFVIQMIIANVLVPRLMSDALGLHPLMVFAAILVSIKVAGFWGAFFGIPIAGVLWAMFKFFYEQWQNGELGGAPAASGGETNLAVGIDSRGE